MGIREREDELFGRWIKERKMRTPFIKDGSHSPEAYEASKHKVVFLLKEPNWGFTRDEQIQYASEQMEVHDQRDDYDTWWKSIAKWCATITYPEWTWQKIEEEVQRGNANDFIAPYPMIQLKKTPGGGAANHNDLYDIAREDSDFLREQLSIYQPRFVIACGTWNILKDVVFDGIFDTDTTSNGIKYFFTDRKLGHENNMCIINFCHPSMRCNSAVRGTVSFGLRNAIESIEQRNANEF